MFRVFLSLKLHEDLNSVLKFQPKVRVLQTEQFVEEFSNRYYDSELILINSAQSGSVLNFLEKEIQLNTTNFHHHNSLACLERNDLFYEILVPVDMKIENFVFLKFLYDGGYFYVA